jgi:hypothetical protein
VVKDIVYTAPGEATIVRGFDAGPSAHPENTNRESGPPTGDATAITHPDPFSQDKLKGAVYVPTGHPDPETVNCAPAMLLSNRTLMGAGVNCATTDFGPSITNVSGFAVPLAAPAQPAN